MKKTFIHKLVFRTLFVFMCVTLLSCSKNKSEDIIIKNIPSSDEILEVDGIYYNITSDEEHTVAVTSSTDNYVGSVVIPETIVYDSVTYSVTTIGERGFYNCYILTSITIPNSVTTIGDYAFKHCNSLTSITIPNNVTTIGKAPFADCISLESIVVNAGNPVYDSRENCNAIIETSSNTLISGCENTIIPNSVTSIGNYAFSNCSYLTSITIPNSVTTIGESAFSYCSGLTSITIPNSVTTIGESVFLGCDGLTSITIPNSVTTIGEEAFADCYNLTSITIPNSVTTIGEEAFTDCSGLTSITIGNNVTNIGKKAFSFCYKLTSVNIPNSVTTIGEEAFADCSDLKDFYCHAESVPTAGYDIFSRVNLSSATLHVPEASLQEYASAAPWNKFGQIVALTRKQRHRTINLGREQSRNRL